MLRFSTTFALVLAGLLLGDVPEDSEPRVFLPVAPGIPDLGNAHLPTVSVFSFRDESTEPWKCSGVLVDPRVVITAAHCVCAPRAPEPEDKLPSGMPMELATGAILMDASSLDELTVTQITDGRSRCVKESFVAALVYRKPGDSRPFELPVVRGKVSIHPKFELVFAAKHGHLWAAWNSADLAAIELERSMLFPPVTLPVSEVKLGEAFVTVGYGAREINDREDYGSRRFGENTVTKLVRLPKGSVLIGATDQPSPDGGAPAHTRFGDSGGACVRKDDPNVLIGITTMGVRPMTGSEISYFTSVFQYKDWVVRMIRRAHRAVGAGMRAPNLDAGMSASGSDAGL